MVHTIRLDNYTPTPRKLVLGTNSSFGTESIKIERGAGWDGLNLTATWHIPGREEPLRVALLDGDAMDVPPEVTKEAKDGVLVLAGLASGVQRASCNVEYLILEQAGVYGGADAEPTPELAAQVLEAALQAKADAEAAAEDAAAAKANADKAQSDAEKAQQAAENAAEDAAKAGPYAEAARAAQEAAELARDEAIAAQQAAENAAAAAAASKSAADTLAAEAARAAQAAENSKAAANNAADLAGENATAAQQAAATAIAAANDAGHVASDAAASKAAAEAAAKAAQAAQTAAAEAKAEAVKAQGAAQKAAKSAQDAQAAAVAAQKDAAASKAAAANSAAAAKASEDAAAKSAADAGRTANSINDSMTQIAANKEAVSRLKEDTTALQKRQNVLVGSETGNPASCNDAFAAPLCGLTVYGKSTQDGTPTPDAPVPIVSAGDSGSVVVKVTGKNLFYEQEFQEYFINSVANTIGLAVGNVSCVLQVVTGAKYYVTRNKIGTKFRVAVVDKLPTLGNPVTPSSGINADSKRQIEISATSKYMVIQCEDEAAFSELMVSLDSSTAYSPYREQLLTLLTPNGLPGIPVTSGGNYTDQNGQQWVCDEVDLERGVKVQRVKRVDISSLDKSYWDFRGDTGANTSSTRYKNNAVMIDFKSNAPAMSNILPVGVANIKNTFRLVATPLYLYQFNLDSSEFPTVESWIEYLEANTVLIIYAPVIPIETPLADAEIAAYKALIPYAPNTVVQASDDAGIKLCYQRDVNLVVKNLEDAIASMTTT